MKSIPYITFTPEVEVAATASCFWTDFVGCVEDCGGDEPPAAGPAVLLFVGPISGSGDDLVPFIPGGGTFPAGSYQLDDITVYTDSGSGSGCDWHDGSDGWLLTTDAALAGTTWDDTADPVRTFTWKLLSDISLAEAASGTGVALSPGAGAGSINSNDLFTALGYEQGGGPFAIVATLHNTTTGDTWEATCLADTCY